MAIIVAVYVVFGGIRGVMYTDALQGTIMFFGMIFLLGAVYWMLGGVVDANQALTNLVNVVPQNATAKAVATGFTGWTSMPALGSPFWWTLVSSLILGVGIGVLSQPQLVVRFHDCQIQQGTQQGSVNGWSFHICDDIQCLRCWMHFQTFTSSSTQDKQLYRQQVETWIRSYQFS